jgi:hypothetical protein
VTGAFAGKQGRCPFCKNSVRIPLQSDPLAKGASGQAGNIENPATDDLRALKAAVLNEELPQPSKPVPPPPQTIEQAEDFQLDLGDNGSGRTDDMPAIQTLRPTVVQAEREQPAAHVIHTPSRRFGLTWLVFAIGVVIVIMAILLVIVFAKQPN